MTDTAIDIATDAVWKAEGQEPDDIAAAVLDALGIPHDLGSAIDANPDVMYQVGRYDERAHILAILHRSEDIADPTVDLVRRIIEASDE